MANDGMCLVPAAPLSRAPPLAQPIPLALSNPFGQATCWSPGFRSGERVHVGTHNRTQPGRRYCSTPNCLLWDARFPPLSAPASWMGPWSPGGVTAPKPSLAPGAHCSRQSELRLGPRRWARGYSVGRGVHRRVAFAWRPLAPAGGGGHIADAGAGAGANCYCYLLRLRRATAHPFRRE